MASGLLSLIQSCQAPDRPETLQLKAAVCAEDQQQRQSQPDLTPLEQHQEPGPSPGRADAGPTLDPMHLWWTLRLIRSSAAPPGERPDIHMDNNGAA